MSVRILASALVALSLLFLSSCAVKIGGSGSRPAPPPPPLVEEAAAAAQGTLVVLPDLRIQEVGSVRNVYFSWEYTNDTGVELARTLDWLCRVYDEEDFIIGRREFGIRASIYGNLEPGAKLRGEEIISARSGGSIARVECFPWDD